MKFYICDKKWDSDLRKQRTEKQSVCIHKKDKLLE